MLSITTISTFYGASQVLFGVSLEIGEGEVVGLLGRNGMGKTTLVRSIMGLTPPSGGEIRFEGELVSGQPPHRIARCGIGLVPEGRQIFPNLSTEENLIATSRNLFDRTNVWSLERIYTLFPRLKERRRLRGNQLSGGEQQMLAIGRALLTNPKLLILDEAGEGLAPLVRSDIWRSIKRLKEERQSILVTDSNLREMLNITDRSYILEKGRVVWEGLSTDLAAQPELLRRYLGI